MVKALRFLRTVFDMLKNSLCKIVFIGFIFSLQYFFVSDIWAKTVVTIDEQKQQFLERFQSSILHLWPEGDGVRILTNGEFLGENEYEHITESWINDFHCDIGGMFIQKPDRHVSVKFTLKEIRDDGVILSYESSFDHRSFGKDLITKDKGTFKVLFKNGEEVKL